MDVARELGVTKASTSRMMKLLTEQGLISVNMDGSIYLTKKGSMEGISIHRKMAGVHTFFEEYIGLDKQEATDSAYTFLCDFSEHCIDALLEKFWTEGLQEIIKDVSGIAK